MFNFSQMPRIARPFGSGGSSTSAAGETRSSNLEPSSQQRISRSVAQPVNRHLKSDEGDGLSFEVDSTAGLQGEVKWFDVKKGFGFIIGPEGEDVFVHFSAIKSDGFRTLKDGEQVRYELHSGDKGLHATNVTRVVADKTATVDAE